MVPYVVGPLDNRTYLVAWGREEGAIVDPSFEIEQVAEGVSRLGIEVRYILNTHGHFDHTMGNAAAKRLFPDARLIYPREDEELIKRLVEAASLFGFAAEPSPPADAYLEDIGDISLGEGALLPIFTPGHSPGHFCLADREGRFILVGDLIFAGSVGRTDLPGGDFATLYRSARRILEGYPPETALYPGHGPATTVEAERRSNPFVGDRATITP